MYNNKMFNQSGNAIRDGGSIAFTGTSYKHITVSVETIDILNNIKIYKDESGAVSGVRCPALENLKQLGRLGYSDICGFANNNFDFPSTRTQPFPFLI